MVKIVLVSLAVWRLSSLLVREEGPFDVFARLRFLAGVRHDVDSNPYGTNWFSKGLVCLWCVSVWFSFIGAFYTAQDPLEWLIHALAISALAIVTDRIT